MKKTWQVHTPNLSFPSYIIRKLAKAKADGREEVKELGGMEEEVKTEVQNFSNSPNLIEDQKMFNNETNLKWVVCQMTYFHTQEI